MAQFSKDWKDIPAEDVDGLPPIMDATKVHVNTFPYPKEIIQKILHKGCKMVVGGPSKSRKTWLLIDLAVSIASGAKWMGSIDCAKGKVLYINLEVKDCFFHYRLDCISTAKDEAVDGLYVWHLRGYAEDIKDFIAKIVKRLEKSDYDLIIIDPIYKLLNGRDENSAGDMTEFLNYLDQLCSKTGAAVVFAAHFPKGNVAKRESMDRIAGSGVFARDPDAIMTMTEHAKCTDKRILFNIESNLRNCEGMPQFVVEWKHPLFEIASGLKVEHKASGSSTVKSDAEELAELLKEKPLSRAEWLKKAEEVLGTTETTFDRRRREAASEGLVKKNPDSLWEFVRRGGDMPCDLEKRNGMIYVSCRSCGVEYHCNQSGPNKPEKAAVDHALLSLAQLCECPEPQDGSEKRFFYS